MGARRRTATGTRRPSGEGDEVSSSKKSKRKAIVQENAEEEGVEQQNGQIPDSPSSPSPSPSPLPISQVVRVHPAQLAVPMHSRFSFRFILALIGVVLLIVCIPYLLLAPSHADSCYIQRSPRRIHVEESMTKASVLNATHGVDVPAAEAIQATPPSGKDRWPTLYFQHQTKWMILLLTLCLTLKIAYAWMYMKPTRRAQPTTRANGRDNDVEPQSPLLSSSSSSSPSSPFAWHWWESSRILLAYLWYLAAYFLCQALKSWLADFNCSTHGNSVSGHCLFHIYVAIVIGYIHASQVGIHGLNVFSRRFWVGLVRGSILNPLFLFFYAAFCIVCCQTLVDTYTFGYHSARQMVYGTLMAIVMALMLTGIMESVEERMASRHIHRPLKMEDGDGDGHRRHVMNVEDETDDDSDTPTGSRRAPPVLTLSYFPFISTILHESCFADERAGRFYTFPLIALIAFQLLSWLLLALSPAPGAFHWADVVAVVLCMLILTWMQMTKFKIHVEDRQKMRHRVAVNNG